MDCTGTPTISRTLRNLVAGLDLQEAWDQRRGNRLYTHYTFSGASRIDRIYATREMKVKKSIEICTEAFSDHLAVILHTGCMTATTTRGRGLWEMNASLLYDSK
jgi:hypothetical protein